MAHTKREVYLVVAAKLGGMRGRCMRATLDQFVHRDLFREKLTETEFTEALRRAEADLPHAFAQFFAVVQAKARMFSWGGSN
jgi:hypothetical protein